MNLAIKKLKRMAIFLGLSNEMKTSSVFFNIQFSGTYKHS